VSGAAGPDAVWRLGGRWRDLDLGDSILSEASHGRILDFCKHLVFPARRERGTPLSLKRYGGNTGATLLSNRYHGLYRQ
jgi:hypothetical protein